MENQQYIAERLANFTPEYVDFLTSGTVETLADTFGEGFGMNDEAINVLENGIMLFLLVFIDKKGLMDFIQSECYMSIADATRLCNAIIDALPASLVYELNRLGNSETSKSTIIDLPSQTIPSTSDSVSQTKIELEKRQQLADLADRFASPAPAARPAPQPVSVATNLQSLASQQVAAVPMAQPRSSAQLTSMSTAVPPSDLQPSVAQAGVNTPPQWQSAATNIAPVNTMGSDAERIHGYGAYREQYPHLYGDEEKNRTAIRSVAQDALLKRTTVVETPNFSDPRP